MKKIKLQLMSDGLFDTSVDIIKDIYPDFFMGQEPTDINDTDESVLIDMFDITKDIIEDMDMNNYELASYDIGRYSGLTDKDLLSDSDKKNIIDYINLLEEVYEDNQYTEEDYDEEEDDDMTPEEKCEHDRFQRQQDYNRIINLINK